MQVFFNSIGEGIKTLIRASGWRDIVDILLVAYLIYQLITLVRRTRAAQLLRGIVVLLIAFFLSRELGLKTMKFLLENVLSFGLLALVVVFQPELRRALEQVGRSKISAFSLFSGRMSSEESSSWNDACVQIADSCEKMAKEKTGALIVIERQTVLDEVIRTGIRLDSDVTAELLETIFYKGSPLHDGAVIVRDARIIAAGCLLPVSQNTRISKDMGTRHRAALGMTENSDAISVVVSEENGIVSVANDGVIARRLDRANLFRVLKSELVPTKEEENVEKGWAGRLMKK
ncbi:MAG: diadenylate cyclase CdaA [Oscillospiraceae bacterium]